jgi:hypothetical protein
MLDLIAILAYLAFVLVTAALIWAIRVVAEKGGTTSDWEPGTCPYNWRF